MYDTLVLYKQLANRIHPAVTRMAEVNPNTAVPLFIFARDPYFRTVRHTLQHNATNTSAQCDTSVSQQIDLMYRQLLPALLLFTFHCDLPFCTVRPLISQHFALIYSHLRPAVLLFTFACDPQFRTLRPALLHSATVQFIIILILFTFITDPRCFYLPSLATRTFAQCNPHFHTMRHALWDIATLQFTCIQV